MTNIEKLKALEILGAVYLGDGSWWTDMKYKFDKLVDMDSRS
jgi:hypothetical protein